MSYVMRSMILCPRPGSPESVTILLGVLVFILIQPGFCPAQYVDPIGTIEAPAGEDASTFGASLAVYDRYVLVGSPGAVDGRGSAYLYDLDSAELVTALTRETPLPSHGFGRSVGLTETYVAVSEEEGFDSFGSVYLFDRLGGIRDKLSIPPGESTLECTAIAVNTASLLASDPGCQVVHVFDLETGKHRWSLNPPSDTLPGEGFGFAIAASNGPEGNIAVGAPYADNGAGAIYLFDRAGAFLRKIVGSGSLLGRFGASLDIDSEDLTAFEPGTGLAYSIEPATGSVERVYEGPIPPALPSLFPQQVVRTNRYVVVGSPATNQASVFDHYTGNLLATVSDGLLPKGASFGAAVAASNGLLAVAAPGADRVYLYRLGCEACVAALRDPVPLNAYQGVLDGSKIRNDPLAIRNARFIGSVAADGAVEIVVEVFVARPPGTAFHISVTSGPDPNQYGSLARLGSSVFSQELIEQTVLPAFRPDLSFGYVVYRAPADFVRPGVDADEQASLRSVGLRVELVGEPGVGRVSSVRIVRPPVVLVHGNWDDPSGWNSFKPLSTNADLRFEVSKAHYSYILSNGVTPSASVMHRQIEAAIRRFREDRGAAAVQADVVAYSLGGLVCRALPKRSDFRAGANFLQGSIHKLITINTPHHGSEFANQLLSQPLFCRALFSANGRPVAQNIVDLAAGSSVLAGLNEPSAPLHLRAHTVTSRASSQQKDSAELAFFGGYLRFACPTLLPASGYDGVLGPGNDLVVAESSQKALDLGFSGSVFGFDPPSSEVLTAAAHTVNTTLFPLGPDVRGRALSGSDLVDAVTPPAIFESVLDVIDLLNTPVYDDQFFREIAP